MCEAVRDRIKELLKEKGLNQNQLELRSGVIHGTMSGIMQNKNKSVDLLTVIKIAGGFDMTVDEFLADPSFHEENIRIETRN